MTKQFEVVMQIWGPLRIWKYFIEIASNLERSSICQFLHEGNMLLFINILLTSSSCWFKITVQHLLVDNQILKKYKIRSNMCHSAR